jgi:hypothetical protein
LIVDAVGILLSMLVAMTMIGTEVMVAMADMEIDQKRTSSSIVHLRMGIVIIAPLIRAVGSR